MLLKEVSQGLERAGADVPLKSSPSMVLSKLFKKKVTCVSCELPEKTNVCGPCTCF